MFTCLVIFSSSLSSALSAFPCLSLIFPCLWNLFYIITFRRLGLVSSNDFLAATTLLFPLFLLFSMLMSSLLLSYRQSHVRLIRLLCISLLEALLLFFFLSHSLFLRVIFFFGNFKQ